MGVFGFVAVGRRHRSACCSAASSPTRSTGTGSSSSTSRSASPSSRSRCGCCRAARGQHRPGAARRRRRGHGDGGADARRLRDRQRQPGGLDVGADARPARRARSALLALFLVHRVAGRVAARAAAACSGCATSRPRTSSACSGRRAMFAWFFLSALYLQLVLGYSPLQVGLAFLPANLIMGALSVGLSAKLVMRFGIRPPLGVGLLLAAVGLAAVRARAGRRQLRRRRAAEHDPARHRRRASRSTRCCSPR